MRYEVLWGSPWVNVPANALQLLFVNIYNNNSHDANVEERECFISGRVAIV